jgi:hypothetical protein
MIDLQIYEPRNMRVDACRQLFVGKIFKAVRAYTSYGRESLSNRF